MVKKNTILIYLKVAVINISGILFLLIITEIILWQIYPIPNLRKKIKSDYIASSFLPNQTFNFISNEGLIGIDSVISFSVNNVGFRGENLDQPKVLDEYRIFMVGGSTTECLYISDNKSIETQLQEYLNFNKKGNINVKVFNAGKSGDISTDHLAMISHRINHLEPNMIVLFLGINDFRRTLSNYKYVQIPEEKPKEELIKDVLITYSQVCRRILIARSNIFFQENQLIIKKESNYKSLARETKLLPVLDSLPSFSTRYFSNNLKSIIGVCDANDIQLLLVTQATTWNSNISNVIKDYHWMTTINDGVRLKETHLDMGLEIFNNEIRKLANEENVIILDLAKIIPKSEDYFYDDCHFNNTGVTYYSNLLGKIIQEESNLNQIINREIQK